MSVFVSALNLPHLIWECTDTYIGLADFSPILTVTFMAPNTLNIDKNASSLTSAS